MLTIFPIQEKSTHVGWNNGYLGSEARIVKQISCCGEVVFGIWLKHHGLWKLTRRSRKLTPRHQKFCATFQILSECLSRTPQFFKTPHFQWNLAWILFFWSTNLGGVVLTMGHILRIWYLAHAQKSPFFLSCLGRFGEKSQNLFKSHDFENCP